MMKGKWLAIVIVGLLVAAGGVFYVLNFPSELSDSQRVAIANAEIKRFDEQRDREGKEKSARERAQQEQGSAKEKQWIRDTCHLNVKPEEIVLERLAAPTDEAHKRFAVAPPDVPFLDTIVRLDGKIRYLTSSDSEGGDTRVSEQFCYGEDGKLRVYIEDFRTFDTEKSQQDIGYNFLGEYDDQGKILPETVKIDYIGNYDKLTPKDYPSPSNYRSASDVEAQISKEKEAPTKAEESADDGPASR